MPTNAHALSRPVRTDTAPAHTSQPEETSPPPTTVPGLGGDTFSASKSRLRKAARTVMLGLDLRPPAPVLRAPDGMVIEASTEVVEVPRTRSERIAAGMKAEVPQRVQQGPTCGLYALGMVMDFWNQQDPSQPTVLISDKDLGGQGYRYNGAPTSNSRMLDYVREAGYTSAGEMFKAKDLAQTASHFGYTASLHEQATLEDLYSVLDAGRPAIVAFDVDYRGNPGDFGGKRAHYAVIQGYFDEDGERYLIARHGWGGQKDYVWKATEFDTSWKALKATDWYGTPGDGIMPDAQYDEPKLLDLPDLGNGEAGIARSLATKIIEVIPRGQNAIGGQIIL